MQIRFTAKIRVNGNVFVVTIPKQYMTNKLLEERKAYEFIISNRSIVPKARGKTDGIQKKA